MEREKATARPDLPHTYQADDEGSGTGLGPCAICQRSKGSSLHQSRPVERAAHATPMERERGS